MAHSGITGNRGLHMQDLWNEQDAAAYAGDLAQRVYSSRLLGRDPALVLHGGGNTSVKVTETNLLGEPEDILYVKGSGWDLESIQESGFAPVRMAHLLKLARLERLSDRQMVNELKTQLTDASAPSPSVETILHAALPYRYVDHTHADAVLAMYHDQGLPVLKHLGFGRAGNITLGLPIVRTSVDHGTAYDIAGQGKADPSSLHAAWCMAAEIAKNRTGVHRYGKRYAGCL